MLNANGVNKSPILLSSLQIRMSMGRKVMFRDCDSLRTQDTKKHCYMYERLQERPGHWAASPTYLRQTL